MFNELCWTLNVVGLPGAAAYLRRTALRLLARRARVWWYDSGPQAGYAGGVDVPWLGTVAFIPYVDGGRTDVPYVFVW